MDFEQARGYLFSLIDYEKKNKGPKSLEPFTHLLSISGHPELGMSNVVKVAGTKAKGSVSHMIAKAFSNAGEKTGLFTSPHLVDPRERIRLDDTPISKEDFAEIFKRIMPLIDGRRGIGTVFETLTLMSLLFFRQNNAKFSIYEAGLGGRLDATSLIPETLTVITPIGFDHTKILGNNLGKIATEKMGISKGRTNLVIARQHPLAMRAITEIIRDKKQKAFVEGIDFNYSITSVTKKGILLNFNYYKKTEPYFIPVMGRFQAQNAAIAIMTLKFLGIEQPSFDGLSIPSRFQIIHKNPDIIIDGAHNAFSLTNAIREFKYYFGKEKKKKTLVFGIMKDKKIDNIKKSLYGPFDRIIFTKPKTPRALDPFLSFTEGKTTMPLKHIEYEKDSKDALEHAMDDNSGIVFITGSFYLCGEIIEHLHLEQKLLGL